MLNTYSYILCTCIYLSVKLTAIIIPSQLLLGIGVIIPSQLLLGVGVIILVLTLVAMVKHGK